MVYYIRFLKTPKLTNGTVRALVTITTDLGDSFYPGNLTIYALVSQSSTQDLPLWESEWHVIQWRSGNRNVWIDVKGIPYQKVRRFQLIVGSKKTKEGDNVFFNDLSEVMSARSGQFGGEDIQADDMVERLYRTGSGHERSLYEESGESIARHIWDAGIALVTYLCKIVKEDKPTALLAKIQSIDDRYSLQILELGAGCGIVGLEMCYLYPASNILLTDLPEAMGILSHNTKQVKSHTHIGQLEIAELNWEKPLPEPLKISPKDIVLVSDCTYNSDSIPALVRTLAALVDVSPTATIVISMKVRHDSEAAFFGLMSEAGFALIENTTISLPDRTRADTDQGLEVVDVYVYAKTHEELAQRIEHTTNAP